MYTTHFHLWVCVKVKLGVNFVLGNNGACDLVIHKTFLWKQKQINWKTTRWKQSKDICKVNHKFLKRDNIKEMVILHHF